MSQERRLKAARKKEIVAQDQRYAEGWAAHSEYHAKQGDYQWMASLVKGHTRILEIGTGIGHGTIALCSQGSLVVSVDTNTVCLAMAERKIRDAKIPVKSQMRGAFRLLDENSYRTDFSEVKLEVPTEGAILLEGDISQDDDPSLTRWLKFRPQFDAVVCWAIGTKSERYKALKGGNSHYRSLIQTHAYDIADAILRDGGVLNVIDRFGDNVAPGVVIRDDVLAQHRALADSTSMSIDESTFETRPYESLPQGSGITVVRTDDTGKRVVSKQMSFGSIISRKVAK